MYIFFGYFAAIMRSFSLLQEAILPYCAVLIADLASKLALVSKVRTLIPRMIRV